ncbi:hypothetical protein OUZ56_021765 [Daphnia magna]|uniref:C2 domain-containing protein n=1 Tax=Daphnia magna TaxID=35525 RepID=A0ABR0AUE8_9CRUS|nr:hypothetical protein OUZ56_021765 [Daphnia magna]
MTDTEKSNKAKPVDSFHGKIGLVYNTANGGAETRQRKIGSITEPVPQLDGSISGPVYTLRGETSCFACNSLRQLLTLKILGALNLPTRSKNIAPDPYVKIVILPERQIKCITKTLKSNCNPLFNQVFELDMSGSPLNKTDILLMVRDRPETSCYERCVSRSVSLGQAIFSMADFNGVNHQRQVRWCLLENTQAISPHADIVNAESVPKAEMQISLLYRVWSDETKLINHGRIILELLQIRPTSFIPNNQDKEKVTIKVLLYERGYLTSSRRTNSIRRDEATAALCQKFVFALQPKMLHEASCQIVLVTKSAIGNPIWISHKSFSHEQREHWDASPWVIVISFLPGQAVQPLQLGLITGTTWHTDPEFQWNAGIR